METLRETPLQLCIRKNELSLVPLTHPKHEEEEIVVIIKMVDSDRIKIYGGTTGICYSN